MNDRYFLRRSFSRTQSRRQRDYFLREDQTTTTRVLVTAAQVSFTLSVCIIRLLLLTTEGLQISTIETDYSTITLLCKSTTSTFERQRHSMLMETSKSAIDDCTDYSMGSSSLGEANPFSAFQYEGLSMPMFGVDANGCIALWNRRLGALSGVTASCLLNGSNTSAVPASKYIRNDNEWNEAFVRALSKGNAKCSVELRCEHEIKMFSATLATQMSSAEVVGVVCFLEEEEEEAEDQQEPQQDATMCNSCRIEAEACTESCCLLQSMEIPIVGVRRDVSISLWNDSFAALSEFDKGDAVGKCLSDFVAPSTRDALQEAVINAIQRQETPSSSSTPGTYVEVELPTKTERIRYLLASVTPWYDDNARSNNNNASDSEIVGALIFFQDVTQATKQDRAMAATALELRQLMDTANTPIFGVDLLGRVAEWNDKIAEITGFSADETFHKPFCTTFIEESRRNVAEAIVQSAIKGRGITNVDVEIRTKYGDVRSLLLSVSPRRNAQNDLVGAIFFAQDTTESAKHDRAVAAMASELRQLIDTANAPVRTFPEQLLNSSITHVLTRYKDFWN